jgi:nicotinate phosphoribosyltransferase
VAKRSSQKESHGGRKAALRALKRSGTIVEEVVHPVGAVPTDLDGLPTRTITVPLVRSGSVVFDTSLDDARARVAAGLHSLPWDGLKLSRGEPAVATRLVSA